LKCRFISFIGDFDEKKCGCVFCFHFGTCRGGGESGVVSPYEYEAHAGFVPKGPIDTCVQEFCVSIK